MPPAENMTRLPDQSLFQGHLARLGKTNIRDPVEAELIDYYRTQQPPRVPNPVFLYELSQIFDKTDGRNSQFATDLQHFLGLDAPLVMQVDPSTLPPWRRVKRFIRNKGAKKTRISPNYHYAIDICEDKYQDLRERLLENGGRAARWIREYFMKDADVTVSNPQHFVKLLDKWTIDPCIKRAQDSATAQGKR